MIFFIHSVAFLLLIVYNVLKITRRSEKIWIWQKESPTDAESE